MVFLSHTYTDQILYRKDVFSQSVAGKWAVKRTGWALTLHHLSRKHCVWMLESQACRTMRVCNVKHIHGLDLHTEEHLVEYSELRRVLKHTELTASRLHISIPLLCQSLPHSSSGLINYLQCTMRNKVIFLFTHTTATYGCYSNLKSDLMKRQRPINILH